MLRLTRAPNIAIAALWADALQQAGFSASVQRYFLGSVAGELPPDQCQPEIWLAHDHEKPRAELLLQSLQFFGGEVDFGWFFGHGGEARAGGPQVQTLEGFEGFGPALGKSLLKLLRCLGQKVGIGLGHAITFGISVSSLTPKYGSPEAELS